jgi:hypothetical protein
MPKKRLPQFVAPKQASRVKKPFETKLDGYRAIAVIDSTGEARIWSRNRLSLEQKFPTVRDTKMPSSLKRSFGGNSSLIKPTLLHFVLPFFFAQNSTFATSSFFEVTDVFSSIGRPLHIA